MSKASIYEAKTESFIKPILDSMNFELVDVEYVKEGGMNYLRAYIDKEGGVVRFERVGRDKKQASVYPVVNE